MHNLVRAVVNKLDRKRGADQILETVLTVGLADLVLVVLVPVFVLMLRVLEKVVMNVLEETLLLVAMVELTAAATEDVFGKAEEEGLAEIAMLDEGFLTADVLFGGGRTKGVVLTRTELEGLTTADEDLGATLVLVALTVELEGLKTRVDVGLAEVLFPADDEEGLTTTDDVFRAGLEVADLAVELGGFTTTVDVGFTTAVDVGFADELFGAAELEGFTTTELVRLGGSDVDFGIEGVEDERGLTIDVVFLTGLSTFVEVRTTISVFVTTSVRVTTLVITGAATVELLTRELFVRLESALLVEVG